MLDDNQPTMIQSIIFNFNWFLV